MKKLIILLLLTGSLAVEAQVSDTFADGDFTHDPRWSGDTALFEVNTSEQLHLKAAAADTAFLSVESSFLPGAEWRFWLKMSFNTSANNHARIYIVSDCQDLEGPLNGYFLQAGGSDDSIAFYRQQGLSLTRLCCCKGLFTGHSTNVLSFRITRDTLGNWVIRADSAGGNNYIPVASFCDLAIPSSSYLGIWCRFTSSNGTKFYFDDLYAGPVEHDTLAPTATRLELCGDDSLRIFFSEPVEYAASCDTLNYLLAGSGHHPSSATNSEGGILLVFAAPFPEGSCDSLLVTGVTDLAGNLVRNTMLDFCHFHAGPNDIVINEILADPYDGGSRFIELYNRTEMPVDLRELAITYYSDDSLSSKAVELTAEPVYLGASGYRASCEDPTDVAARYIDADTSCCFLTPSFPGLAASGGTITLERISDGAVIDRVIYSETMHHPLLSTTEGISLERVSFCASSLDPSNWHSAAASAGYATPGCRNSQWWEPKEQEDAEVLLEPQVFSPDNDGKDDVLHIICHPPYNDFMATVIVYDSRGRRIREIAGNEHLGTEGFFSWDGITEDRTKANAGIYIVYIELIRMDGTVHRYKKATVLAVKF